MPTLSLDAIQQRITQKDSELRTPRLSSKTAKIVCRPSLYGKWNFTISMVELNRRLQWLLRDRFVLPPAQSVQ
jgi:hypothetical protein